MRPERLLFVTALATLLYVTPPRTSAQTLDALEGAAAETPAWYRASPQMALILGVYRRISGTPITELSPQDARQQFSAEDAAKILARATGAAKSAQPVGKVTDGMTVPGPAGPLPIRIYTPSGSGPFPVVVYFHGGGFVLATIDTYDASARALTDSAGAIVVSVEYRKAPEHPFPAALEDAVAAYRWVLAHAGSFNGDASRVAVAGESAGGNLATEVCLQARADGFAMPRYQLLIYPVTDFSIDYPSDRTYYNAQPLSTPALLWFTKYYLPNSAEATDPRASPLRADLAGLPPATLIAAQIDPLLDEGRAYARKLQSLGIPVPYQLYTGVTHEFFGMGAVLEEARDAERVAGSDLRRALGE